ncbi:MAG: metal-sulfur cluster assembly factor [Phycisphaerae bacterium]
MKPPSKWPVAEPFATPWIQEALRTVIDPEIGVNIVDLGLIYETRIEEAMVTVTMTMTTPACPMTEMIVSDVKTSLQRAGDRITTVNVDVVWDPPWVPEMISVEARERMGWR